MEIENGNWEGLQEGGGECDVMYDVLFVVEVVRIEGAKLAEASSRECRSAANRARKQ